MWPSLPVELKIEILKLCSGCDKINFGIAIGGDQSLISNKEIWREVTLNHPSDIVECQRYLGAHTRKLTFILDPKPSFIKRFKISESLLKGICRHCPLLEELTLLDNFALDSDIKFSMFPKTIKILRLLNISMKIDRDVAGMTPFFRIKKEMPSV